MEKQEAQKRLEALREQIRYHSRKYYTEDDPILNTTSCTVNWKRWRRSSPAW
mgnify:CR=1 FL=1